MKSVLVKYAHTMDKKLVFCKEIQNTMLSLMRRNIYRERE
jgi:hypothetical protein